MAAGDSIGERVARLEVRMENLEADAAAVLRRQERIEEKLDTLLSEITHYKGKLGGVLLAVSAIVTAVISIGGAGWEWIKSILPAAQ